MQPENLISFIALQCFESTEKWLIYVEPTGTRTMFYKQQFIKLVHFFENLSNLTSPFEKLKQHQ